MKWKSVICLSFSVVPVFVQAKMNIDEGYVKTAIVNDGYNHCVGLGADGVAVVFHDGQTIELVEGSEDFASKMYSSIKLMDALASGRHGRSVSLLKMLDSRYRGKALTYCEYNDAHYTMKFTVEDSGEAYEVIKSRLEQYDIGLVYQKGVSVQIDIEFDTRSQVESYRRFFESEESLASVVYMHRPQ
ncbi:hypothetical protein [Vibrio barjaei]|uniref:hypothetical protein n=1 Tax=Vibrio barjaei TaxID=1676683 RepID=UPI0022849CA0|nr:hypothetical protein [Vibrio barjaei]MCY9870457.1 hypothetical protein [Vibrio barjaei]